MTAHGDVIRSHEVFPVRGLREAGHHGAERQSPRDRTFTFLAALAAILALGLVIYGFHEALQTINTINLPPYSPNWPPTF